MNDKCRSFIINTPLSEVGLVLDVIHDLCTPNTNMGSHPYNPIDEVHESTYQLES